MSADTVRKGPLIEAVVRNDGSGEVRIDGTAYHVDAAGIAEARIEVLRHVTDSAIRLGRPVRASAEGPEGVWNLVVHPDGTVVPDETGPTPSAPTPIATGNLTEAQNPAQTQAPTPTPEPTPEPEGESPEAATAAAPVTAATPEPSAPEPSADASPESSAIPAPFEPSAIPAAEPGQAEPRPSPEPRPAAEAEPARSPEPHEPAAFSPAQLSTFGHEASRAPGREPAIPAGPLDTIRGFGTVTTPSDMNIPASTVPDTGLDVLPGDTRRSFLTQVSVEEPAEQGMRGWLTRMGVRMSPNASERAERTDEREVSQHWPGPRTISIVNGKGGAGKTPSSVLLSAVFAQYGGAGVVAWDNNQTRGTLGWRTEKGPHDATLLDMLPRTDHLLGPSAQAADLARYVHHQTRDRYDVLRSKPMAMANEQRIDPADVDSIHSVLSKYYRLIIIDSGNDESDPMWQRMIDLTDQLVIATTTRDDHAEAGALLLEGLAQRDGRSAYLAQQAVVVVSQADQKAPQHELRDVAAGYAPIAREVVTVPFDPGMVDGHLRYGALRGSTKRAWLAAGAAVARGL